MPPLKRTNCVKCPDGKGVAVLNKKDVYCRPCFLHYVSHRFRSTLGKQKIFKSVQKVLLMISGGASSSALLDLIEQSLSTTEQKKLKIEPILVHLIESDDAADNCFEFIDRLKSTGFPLHAYHLADVLFSSESDNFEQFSFDVRNRCAERTNDLKNLLLATKSRTARLDLYHRLKLYCIIRIARQLDVQYVLLGDNCTLLSASMLADVAQGRGGQIKDRVSVLDKRWGDTIVVRLLCELQDKELALYNYFRNIRYHYHEKVNDLSPALAAVSSIQSETRDFVVDLQDQFPATVCTLFSTASKLASTTNKTDAAKCRLCSSIVDDVTNDYGRDGSLNHFCYGCRLTINEIDSFQTLLPKTLR